MSFIIKRSRLFDNTYYLSQNPDVKAAAINPLFHYVSWGDQEFRYPRETFEPSYYRSQVKGFTIQVNTLLHYLLVGKYKNISTIQTLKISHYSVEHTTESQCAEISEAMWDCLTVDDRVIEKKIDVIIPVFKNKLLTFKCLYSVLTAVNDVKFELVVINDHSPEKEISYKLRSLARRGLITLIENTYNMGFILSVNKGMMLHLDRDVVLLNSDTEVYENWLSRLSASAHRNSKTASVTPLSNNATICSYPDVNSENTYPLEISYALLDKTVACVNNSIEIEIPTGVGFCLFLKRKAINEIGLFDAQTFGMGYGEENQWCRQAVQNGWINIAAADVFVRHAGGASFLDSKQKKINKALKELNKKFPNYQKIISDFVGLDPLSQARSNIDLARLKMECKSENILVIFHRRGGGTERHVYEDVQLMLNQGKGVFFLKPDPINANHVRIEHYKCRSVPNIQPFQLSDTSGLCTLFKDLNITGIHIHSLIDFSDHGSTEILAIAKHLGLSIEIDIHDYHCICPRINLVDRNSQYCGEPDEIGCDLCLIKNKQRTMGIKLWRNNSQELMQFSKNIWVPNLDVSKRLMAYFSNIKVSILPHENIEQPEIIQPKIKEKKKLRVVIIGAINEIKGYKVLLASAKNAKERKLPIEFIVMGYTINDRQLTDFGVIILGRYVDDFAMDTLHSIKPHCIWLPSIWPETYSYTFSLALKCHYPIFSFNIGAIPNRMRENGLGNMILPLDLSRKPEKINNRFLEYRSTCLKQ